MILLNVIYFLRIKILPNCCAMSLDKPFTFQFGDGLTKANRLDVMEFLLNSIYNFGLHLALCC